MATTTSSRGYPIPQSTDNVRPYADTEALGIAVDTDVQSVSDDALSTSSVAASTAGSLATGFTTTGGVIRTGLGGALVDLGLTVVSTNALTATAGNIPDTVCFTLNSAYRPSEPKGALISGLGGVTGSATINTDGTVVLLSASDTIAAASTVRINAAYLRAA